MVGGLISSSLIYSAEAQGGRPPPPPPPPSTTTTAAPILVTSTSLPPTLPVVTQASSSQSAVVTTPVPVLDTSTPLPPTLPVVTNAPTSRNATNPTPAPVDITTATLSPALINRTNGSNRTTTLAPALQIGAPAGGNFSTMGIALMTGGVVILIVIVLLGTVYLYKRFGRNTAIASNEEVDTEEATLENGEYLAPVALNHSYDSALPFTGHSDYLVPVPLDSSDYTELTVLEQDGYMIPVGNNPDYQANAKTPWSDIYCVGVSPGLFSLNRNKMALPAPGNSAFNENVYDAALGVNLFTESNLDDSGVYNMADYAPLTTFPLSDYDLATAAVYAVAQPSRSSQNPVGHSKQAFFSASVLMRAPRVEEPHLYHYQA